MAAAEPALDPRDPSSVFHRLRVWPPYRMSPKARAPTLVFPIRTPPAAAQPPDHLSISFGNPLCEWFGTPFRGDPGVQDVLGGGALAVYIDGKPVVDVWTGWSDRAGEQPWTADTGAMVFSATKGMAATVIHRLVDRGLLAYDEPVAEYWPEFGANGKADITVRDVLRHRAGLSHLKGVSKDELLDHHLMEERLAAAPVDHSARVARVPRADLRMAAVGAGRAVTGMGMRDLIREEVARPLNTDGLHLGRPPAGSPTKVAQILVAAERTRANPVFNFVAPKVAGLPFSGAFGAMYFPGIKSFVQGDIPFLDGEVPAANGVVTAPRPGQDVRGDRQRRRDRRQRVPVRRAGRRA